MLSVVILSFGILLLDSQKNWENGIIKISHVENFYVASALIYRVCQNCLEHLKIKF